MKNLNFLPKEYVEKYSNYKIIPEDIVLGLNRPIINNRLKIAQVPKELKKSLLYQRAGKVEFLKAIDIDFTYHLLGNEIYKFVLKEAVGSDQPFISTTILKDWDLSIPKTEKEQQKIGQFFKLLDEMITLEQRKIDKTKALKSSYLAEMFPAEGERVPKRRFAEFKDVWKKMQLGDVLCVNSGKDYKHLNQGNIPVYGTGGLMLYVDDKLSNVDGIGIGRKGTLDRPQYLKAPFWTVDTLYFLTSIHKVDLYFMYVKTQTIDWKKKDESSGVPSLSKNSIEKTTIYLPCIKEQQKLGAFFKKIDATIINHQRKLDKLKATKQAYLHQMFV